MSAALRARPPGEERSRLGRGLAALIGDANEEFVTVESGRSGPRRLPVAFLRPNPRNPRRSFGEQELGELAESIRAKGVVQPIVVRPVAGTRDAYEIIAGERRWRASQMAEQHEVPVVVLEVSDREALEIALVENVQRADLNAIEEAAAYEQLIAEFGYSHTELGAVIGKSRSHVANTLRLLKLSDQVKSYMHDGRLSAGHARALLNMPDPEAAAERIVATGMSVREVEALAQEERPSPKTRAPKAEPDVDVRDLEKTLSDLLGLGVSVRQGAGERGEVRISYRTLEQLDEVCRRLRG